MNKIILLSQHTALVFKIYNPLVKRGWGWGGAVGEQGGKK